MKTGLGINCTYDHQTSFSWIRANFYRRLFSWFSYLSISFFNCTCTSLVLWILKLYGNIYARFSNMYFYLSFEKMRKWVNEWMNKSVWFNLTLFYKRGQLSTFQGRSMQMKSYVWWEGTNSLSFACIEGLSNLQLRLNYI